MDLTVLRCQHAKIVNAAALRAPRYFRQRIPDLPPRRACFPFRRTRPWPVTSMGSELGVASLWHSLSSRQITGVDEASGVNRISMSLPYRQHRSSAI